MKQRNGGRHGREDYAKRNTTKTGRQREYDRFCIGVLGRFAAPGATRRGRNSARELPEKGVGVDSARHGTQ